MPSYRADLTRLTVSDLEQLTGLRRETIRKRLKAEPAVESVARDGRSVWYAATAALERVYLGEDLDLTRERARLAKEQADAQQLKNAQARRELIPPEEMDLAILAFASILKSRFRGLGMAAAPKLAAESKPAACRGIVDEAVAEILADLAEEAEACKARAQKDSARGNGAAAPKNGRGDLGRLPSDAPASEANDSRVG